MPSKQTEPKPRLAKDEVDLLENEFKKNPKPSSQRKREIAELLNVENPRINNWFQNRRAKAKQLLRREMDTRAPGDESPSGTPPEQKDIAMSEFYSTTEPSQQLQASTAGFSTTEQQRHLDFFAPTHDAPAANNISPSVEEYPSPKSLVFPPVNTQDLSYGPVAHNFVTPDTSSACQDGGLDTFEGLDHDQVLQDLDQSLSAFVPFTTTMGMEAIMSAPTIPFHTELLGMDGIPHLSHGSVSSLPCETQAMNHGLSSAIQQMSSPTSSAHSPLSAVSDLRFKSPPPPANIATRRNKGAPAMLNPTSLRTNPYSPKTGVDLGKRVDAPGPIRRISSANGLINRIQKPAGASAPRSPLYFERNKEALIHSLQNVTTAAAAAPAGVSATGCSVTLVPSASGNASPVITRMQNVETESGAPASDEDLSFSLTTSVPHTFFNSGPTLKTPPGTPGLQDGGNADQRVAVDIWNFAPQDEALLTPSLGSFGSDEFQILSSAAAYTANSQPPTPSLGQQVGNGCMPMMFHGNGMGSVDYTFPAEAYGLSESLSKSSPGHSRSKQFQFTQNITPDDFFSLEK